MFNIGWSEMLIVAAIALIVVGPKDLPAMLRQLGRAFATVRRMGNEFKAEVNKVAALDEVKDIKKSITEPLKETHEDLTNQFNLADENGVRPSGALKPKDENVESVADEIREAVGMEPEAPKPVAPPPNEAAAASMKASIAAAQAKQAEEKAKAEEAAQEATKAQEGEKTPAPKKRTRKAATTKSTSAAKTTRASRAKTTTAKKPAATKSAAKSTTAKTTTRKTTARKPAAKKTTAANSGDAS